MCACRLCAEHAEWDAICATGDREQLLKLIEHLRDRVAHAEMDNSYHNAIMDGSWPSAIEILEAAIKKCPPNAREAV